MITSKKTSIAKRQGTRLASSALMMLSLTTGWATAGELEPGFVINKDNLEKIQNDTFEGKAIGSMIPEKLGWMIKNQGLTIKIAHSKKIQMDAKYVEASQKSLKSVKFNPADRTVSGWTSGMLFPPEAIM